MKIYVNSKACVKIGISVSEGFRAKVGLCLVCVTSPCLFDFCGHCGKRGEKIKSKVKV